MSDRRTCQATREDLSAWIDGVLDPADRESFEGHLAACAGCRAEADRMQQIVQALAEVEAVPVPADLGPRLREAFRAERREPQPNPEASPSLLRRLGPWRIAASILILGLGAEVLLRESGVLPAPRSAAKMPAKGEVAEAEPGGKASGESFWTSPAIEKRLEPELVDLAAGAEKPEPTELVEAPSSRVLTLETGSAATGSEAAGGLPTEKPGDADDEAPGLRKEARDPDVARGQPVETREFQRDEKAKTADSTGAEKEATAARRPETDGGGKDKNGEAKGDGAEAPAPETAVPAEEGFLGRIRPPEIPGGFEAADFLAWRSTLVKERKRLGSWGETLPRRLDSFERRLKAAAAEDYKAKSRDGAAGESESGDRKPRTGGVYVPRDADLAALEARIREVGGRSFLERAAPATGYFGSAAGNGGGGAETKDGGRASTSAEILIVEIPASAVQEFLADRPGLASRLIPLDQVEPPANARNRDSRGAPGAGAKKSVPSDGPAKAPVSGAPAAAAPSAPAAKDEGTRLPAGEDPSKTPGGTPSDEAHSFMPPVRILVIVPPKK